MRIGHLIKQHLCDDHGRTVSRHGVVLRLLPRNRIRVLWFPNNVRPREKHLYEEIIKMELIEIISEIR